MNILLLGTRLLFILGIVNLLAGLLIFFSCRCLPGSRIGGNLMKHPAYQRFFKLHCHIWKVFWSSVIIHASLALAIIGWPA